MDGGIDVIYSEKKDEVVGTFQDNETLSFTGAGDGFDSGFSSGFG